MTLATAIAMATIMANAKWPNGYDSGEDDDYDYEYVYDYVFRWVMALGLWTGFIPTRFWQEEEGLGDNCRQPIPSASRHTRWCVCRV
jgi:hypothetical protein